MNPENENPNPLKSVLRIAIPITGFLLLYYTVIYFYDKHNQNQKNIDAPVIKTQSDSTSTQNVDSLMYNSQNDSLVKHLNLVRFKEHVNINDALENIAGVEGSVSWTYDYHPVKYKYNPSLFIAKGHAEGRENDKQATFDIFILINRDNQRFEVLYAIEDGKKIKGMLIFLSLALRGGYSENADPTF